MSRLRSNAIKFLEIVVLALSKPPEVIDGSLSHEYLMTVLTLEYLTSTLINDYLTSTAIKLYSFLFRISSRFDRATTRVLPTRMTSTFPLYHQVIRLWKLIGWRWRARSLLKSYWPTNHPFTYLGRWSWLAVVKIRGSSSHF